MNRSFKNQMQELLNTLFPWQQLELFQDGNDLVLDLKECDCKIHPYREKEVIFHSKITGLLAVKNTHLHFSVIDNDQKFNEIPVFEYRLKG